MNYFRTFTELLKVPVLYDPLWHGSTLIQQHRLLRPDRRLRFHNALKTPAGGGSGRGKGFKGLRMARLHQTTPVKKSSLAYFYIPLLHHIGHKITLGKCDISHLICPDSSFHLSG